jgi:predicted RNase H-like nuclease (RuvC/YqgF family)
VLCYLEGQTRDQAARQLGWSLRTLDRRLVRGRELLRLRLARRGLTLSAGLLVATMADHAAYAAVPGTVGQRAQQESSRQDAEHLRPRKKNLREENRRLSEGIRQLKDEAQALTEQLRQMNQGSGGGAPKKY